MHPPGAWRHSVYLGRFLRYGSSPYERNEQCLMHWVPLHDSVWTLYAFYDNYNDESDDNNDGADDDVHDDKAATIL